jgi:hypothetical protein
MCWLAVAFTLGTNGEHHEQANVSAISDQTSKPEKCSQPDLGAVQTVESRQANCQNATGHDKMSNCPKIESMKSKLLRIYLRRALRRNRHMAALHEGGLLLITLNNC